MNREDLMKFTKEQLIKMLFDYQNQVERLEKNIDELHQNQVETRFKDYIYEDYVETKKQLNFQIQSNNLNQNKIEELYNLLDRYKSIVDKLGSQTP